MRTAGRPDGCFSITGAEIWLILACGPAAIYVARLGPARYDKVDVPGSASASRSAGKEFGIFKARPVGRGWGVS